jgi:hypothetical protein
MDLVFNSLCPIWTAFSYKIATKSHRLAHTHIRRQKEQEEHGTQMASSATLSQHSSIPNRSEPATRPLSSNESCLGLSKKRIGSDPCRSSPNPHRTEIQRLSSSTGDRRYTPANKRASYWPPANPRFSSLVSGSR